MKPRISMITLGVDDLDRAINFYEEGLGFPRMESPPSVAFFTLNGTWLGLYDREALAEDAQVSAEGKCFSGFSLAHNVSTEKEVNDYFGLAPQMKTHNTHSGQRPATPPATNNC
ncbi:MAG: VOC family protein [Mariprofundus sp.]|nr:VOC family protein [Mariprofundus sp.]